MGLEIVYYIFAKFSGEIEISSTHISSADDSEKMRKMQLPVCPPVTF